MVEKVQTSSFKELFLKCSSLLEDYARDLQAAQHENKDEWTVCKDDADNIAKNKALPHHKCLEQVKDLSANIVIDEYEDIAKVRMNMNNEKEDYDKCVSRVIQQTGRLKRVYHKKLNAEKARQATESKASEAMDANRESRQRRRRIV